ncbi:MAG: hypothetical protein L0G69_12165 [Brevibacterium sp.]|nr:hypothetical protein [Brevibacterium sp.]
MAEESNTNKKSNRVYKTVLRYIPGSAVIVPVQIPPKPVKTWVTNEEGKRAPVGPQDTDENGIPMWSATATLMKDSFGDIDPELVEIVFPSKETPKSIPAEVLGQVR